MNDLEFSIKHRTRAGMRRTSWKEFAFVVFGAAFQAIGAVYLLVEIATYFNEPIKVTIQNWKLFLLLPIFIWICIRLLLLARKNAPFKPLRYQLEGGNAFIEIVMGDIFQADGDLIVPVSRTFDTSKDKEVIDPKSILGQFIDCNYSDPDHLRQDIEKALATEPYDLLERSQKTFGLLKEYPLGTCAKINNKDETTYLVALT